MKGQELYVLLFVIAAFIAAIVTAVSMFQKSHYQDYQEEGFSGSTEYIFAGVGIAVALIFAALKGFTKVLDS